MMVTYEHCEHCGRLISEGDVYCGFCRGIAETDISELDMIHDPETDPLPHHEFPETDQRPFSLKKQGNRTLIGRQNENRSRLC